MPEGPEIRRAADSLEAAIKGKTLTHVWFAFPQLKQFETELVGETVTQSALRRLACGKGGRAAANDPRAASAATNGG